MFSTFTVIIPMEKKKKKKHLAFRQDAFISFEVSKPKPISFLLMQRYIEKRLVPVFKETCTADM